MFIKLFIANLCPSQVNDNPYLKKWNWKFCIPKFEKKITNFPLKNVFHGKSQISGVIRDSEGPGRNGSYD